MEELDRAELVKTDTGIHIVRGRRASQLYDHARNDIEQGPRKAVKVQVGVGVTEHVGSDSFPGVIVHVSKSGKQIKYTRVQHGKPRDPHPGYLNAPGILDEVLNPDCQSTARWSEKDRCYKHYGRHVAVGYALYSRDPHF
jgi:hypothetical protein